MLKKIDNGENRKVNNYHAIPVGFKKKRKNNLYKTINSRIPRHNTMSCIIVFCDKIVYCQRQNNNKLMTELTLHLLQYHI